MPVALSLIATEMGELNVARQVGAALRDGDDMVDAHLGLRDGCAADAANATVPLKDGVTIYRDGGHSSLAGAQGVLGLEMILPSPLGMLRLPALYSQAVGLAVATHIVDAALFLMRLPVGGFLGHEFVMVLASVERVVRTHLFLIRLIPRLAGGAAPSLVGVVPSPRALPGSLAALFSRSGGN